MTERRADLAVAALVAALSWPLASDLEPSAGLDGDWQIALHVALRQGLDFGPDFLFTYGPLGFLHYPVLVDPVLARVAFAVTVAVHLGICILLLSQLRPVLRSLPLAAAGTLLVASVIYEGATVFIGFAAAAALVTRAAEPRRRLLLAAALAALAGLELLAKLNTGIALLGLAAIALACAPEARPRLAAAFTGVLALTLAVGWAIAGQSLGAVDDYVAGEFQIVTGYSEAMGFAGAGMGAVAGEYGAALAIAALGAILAWRAGGALPARGRVGLVLLWSLLWFTAFKAAFVRSDAGHLNVFFGTTLGGLAVLARPGERRRTPILIGCALILALSISLSRDAEGLPEAFFSPWERAANLASQTATLLDGSRTAAAISKTRRARVAEARISAPALAAARTRPTHVDPFAAGLAWALDLPWRPLPVFQSYSAYTAGLDERNADALRDPDGPAALLRQAGAVVDIRNPAWESPAAMRALLCHFEAREGDQRWQVVERTAPRCGRERSLGTVTVRLGRPARVPPPPDRRSLVFARIDGIAVDGLETLRATAFRARTRHVVLDGGRRFRLVPGTAADGLIMSVPRAADFPAPFGLDQATRTLTVERGDGAQPDDEVAIHYAAVSIRPPN